MAEQRNRTEVAGKGMRYPTLPTTVEYTEGGVRVRRAFPNQHKARRFYAEKFAAGADPKLVKIG